MPVLSSGGGTVRVYRFQVYDIRNDEMVTSTRMATEAAIERVRGVKLSASYEVPSDHVGPDGFTDRMYVPLGA